MKAAWPSCRRSVGDLPPLGATLSPKDVRASRASLKRTGRPRKAFSSTVGGVFRAKVSEIETVTLVVSADENTVPENVEPCNWPRVHRAWLRAALQAPAI